MPARRSHRRTKQANRHHRRLPERITATTDVATLTNRIFDPQRTTPLLLVSCASDTGRPRVDVDTLKADLGKAADIVVLGLGQPAFAFSDSVPPGFHTYGGSVRLVWPSATPEDPRTHHDLFLTPDEAQSGRTIFRIRRTLRQHGYIETDSTEPPSEAVFSTTTPPPGEQSPEPGTTATEPPLAAPLEEAAQEIAALTAALTAATERAAALAAENATLKRQVRSLNDQVEALEHQAHHTGVYSDPEQQMRHEIEHHWLTSLSEPDRATYPLATYTFGPDFLTSVDTIEGVDRTKIISTAVEVLTRRAWSINGRQTHQFRETAAAGSPALTREDGATAWRCNLQTSTASARRMMWWEVPDGTIELATVAIHDDANIR